MIKRIRGSLTAKIFAVTTLLLALACGITYAVIALSLPVSYEITITTQLQEDLDALAERLSSVTIEDSAPVLNAFQLKTGSQVEVLDENGSPIAIDNFVTVSDWSVAPDVTSVTVTEAEGEAVIETYTISSEEAPYALSLGLETAVEASAVGQEVQFAEEDMRYVIIARPDVQAVNQAETALRQMLPVLVGCVLLVSLLGAVAISLYVTRPIVRLSSISKKLSMLDFSWTYETRRTDEIGVLAQGLHTLSTRLSEALESLRGEVKREKELQRRRSEFFSAVSHELKTPLTVIQGQLEGMIAGIGVYSDRDAYLVKTLDTAHQMSGMVQDILQVFRMDQAQFALRRESIDLAALARETAEAYAPLYAHQGVTLAVQAEEAVWICGDGALLRRALGNLLDNAAQYSPEGAQATLRVWDVAAGAHIEVENSGAHIPEEALPHLFEAFYRGEASRSRATGGTGLGLHLVAGVLRRHGAAYAIENTPDGVRVSVTLPKDHTETT